MGYYNSQQKLVQDSYKMIVGRDQYEIVVLEIKFNSDYFSITSESYEHNFMTEETGQERADDYCDDDFMLEEWKYAVQNNSTTDSLESYKEDYLNDRDWTEIVGDITEIDTEDKMYYTQMIGCGASVPVDNLEKTKLTHNELNILRQADKKLHLKSLKEISQDPRLNKVLQNTVNIFKENEMHDISEIYEYSSQYEDKLAEDKEENDEIE